MNILKKYGKKIKYYTCVIYYCYKQNKLSIFIKIFAIILIGYALSPIDLIPDFIPIIGYLDDLIILSFGIYILLKIIPENILKEAERKIKTGKYCKEINFNKKFKF